MYKKGAFIVVVVFLLVLFLGSVSAETISEWASSVDTGSYYNSNWEPSFAVGEKDGSCNQWKSTSAWCKSIRGEDSSISLFFEQEVYATDIKIYFTGTGYKDFNVNEIKLLKPDGTWDVVWTGENKKCEFQISFDIRNYKTKQVKIKTAKNSWGCVDAVKLTGSTEESEQTCEEYCYSRPHIECAGYMEYSGTYPDCVCEWICQTNDEDPCGGSDINGDGKVDSSDNNLLSGYWERQDCEDPNWCGGADINKDGKVDASDLSILAGNYGKTNCFSGSQGSPCVDAGYKCTSEVRGCGHYKEKDLDCEAGAGVICCEEIPYCGDGVCFEHDSEGYGENYENCPEDCEIEIKETEIVDRCLELSSDMKNNMAEYREMASIGGHSFVDIEGNKIGEDDYVILYAPSLEDKAVIFEVIDISITEGGALDDYVTFLNVLTGLEYRATNNFSKSRKQMAFGADEVWVEVIDMGDVSPRYAVSLQWGEGSASGGVGAQQDTFNCGYGSGTCKSLIEKVRNPSDFTDGDLEYFVSWNWTNDWNMWINGEEEGVTSYYTNWHTYYEGKNYGLYYVVNVFDDENIDLEGWLEQNIENSICIPETFGDSEKEEVVYICNYDLLRQTNLLDEYSGESRTVLWTNKNIAVEIHIYVGKWLSHEEFLKLSQKKLNEFLNDLKNNKFDFVDWENFRINWPLSVQIERALIECPSEISEQCVPCWHCKIEPAICPPHGYQMRTCVDYCCDGKKEERIMCSPGVCSGCLVPFSFSSDENKCIPYGFRFEQEGEWDYILVEREEKESLSEEEAANEESVDLEVISNQEAILTVYDWGGQTYTLVPGAEIEVDLSEFAEDDLEELIMVVDEIVYLENGESYVEFTFKIKGWDRQYNEINAYCDIDGKVKVQKQDWSRCQNNYECESNFCSGHECIGVTQALQEVSGFKSLLARVLCRIAWVFRLEDSYEGCIMDYLGEEAN